MVNLVRLCCPIPWTGGAFYRYPMQMSCAQDRLVTPHPIHGPRPAAFLDRDGVLNVDSGYVSRSEDFQWLPGAIAAVKRLNDAGYLVIVVTNQSGIARGYYGEAAFHALTDWMRVELAKTGACLDGVYHCPHHPEHTGPCDCRKPLPGLLKAAFKHFAIDQERSFLIGDSKRDIQAAEAAGIPGHLFTGGNLDDFVREILEQK